MVSPDDLISDMWTGDDEVGYLQWEDNFLVTETGVEVLSVSPKEIWLTE